MLVADGLEVLVETFVAEHDQNNVGPSLVLNEGIELLGEAVSVICTVDFDPRRIFNVNA